MRKLKNQRLIDVSDEQIKKAFDLKKRGLQVDRISEVTGLTKHSLHVWFAKPPQILISRIQSSELLRTLIVEKEKLETQTVKGVEQVEISGQERNSIPLVDRRGKGVGFASKQSIDLAVKEGRELNNISPISVIFDSTAITREAKVERALELTSTTTTSNSTSNSSSTSINSDISSFEMDSRNMVELNSKLVDYRKIVEEHLVAVNSLLSNLDTLSYIESLEDAEVEYRNRIEKLEEEVTRLRTVERQL